MKTKEALLARKEAILASLSKHYQKDPAKLENFVSKYPDLSESDIALDPSSEVTEFEEYEANLGIEQAMEQELIEVEEQLAAIE